MKKILLYTFAVLLVCAVVFGCMVVYSHKSAQSNLTLEQETDNLGVMPLSIDNIVEFAPGLRFRIDTGSSSNTISPEYLKMLKDMGCRVDSSFRPKIIKSAIGEKRITTRRYTVDLPVNKYRVITDSTGVRTASDLDPEERVNTVLNVDFVPAKPGEKPRLGLQFIRKFYMEFLIDLHAIRFWRKMPDNYKEIGQMYAKTSPLWEGKRFMDMSINGQKHSFFINTSMPRVSILMPEDMAGDVDGETVFNDTIPSVLGDRPGVIDYKVWVEWGNRGGNNVAFFSSYGSEPFAVNPFFFLKQNAVFDFENNRVYIPPVSARIQRTRSNDIFASK